jgi:hypothetical protein
VDALVAAVELNPTNVTPRVLNIARFEMRGDPLRQVPVPFNCDDCHLLPALYGDPQQPGRFLRCPACHLKSIGQSL